MMKTRFVNLIAAISVFLGSVSAGAQSIMDPPFGRPDAVIDLATRKGAELVKGQWRYSDTRIIEVDSRGVGPDLKPPPRSERFTVPTKSGAWPPLPMSTKCFFTWTELELRMQQHRSDLAFDKLLAI
jgi:hypothetical protein